MRVLNFGSLNVDLVYRVPRIVRPGETLTSRSVETFPGGKGANQSIALARAGIEVMHAGRIGSDGRWLLDLLREAGVDVRRIREGEGVTGHAIIQVDDSGENAIVLFAGENAGLTRADIDAAMAQCEAGDVLLLQNETNDVAYLIEAGHRQGLHVCLNPAPFSAEVRDYPLDLVDTLILNETEATSLTGECSAAAAMQVLASRGRAWEVVLTLGARGVMYRGSAGALVVPAWPVAVVDTTGAGDTFIGYFLSGRSEGLEVRACLELACRAAAACVSCLGAGNSIPFRGDLK